MADNFYGVRDIKADVDAPQEDVIVRLNNVHKTYLLGVEGVPALRGVSLSILRGEFVVIFGLSGGGKTTLLNVIGTIDKPTKGEIILCGHRIDSTTTDATLSYLRLKKIGFVFQTFNLLSSLTAIENVEMPMILAGTEQAERRKRAKKLLSRVGMGPRLDHVPSQLSGGEQQRVTIARSVANNPDLLLLDEPTGDLDSRNTCIAMQLLLELNKEGITMVMVTHDVSLKNFANRVIWMRDGKIQNVEEISQEKRKRRIEELNAELEELNKGKKIHREKYLNTVIRQPTFYKTHPHYQKQEPKPYTFSEEYKKMQGITQEEYEDKTNLKKKHKKGDDEHPTNGNGNYSNGLNEDVSSQDGEEAVELPLIM
jgi:putative ABC transport system ATP-binding protein